MNALGWISLFRRTPLASWLGRRRARSPLARRSSVGLESLEPIALLSRAGLPLPVAVSAPIPADIRVTSTALQSSTQTTSGQLVNVSPQLTNIMAAQFQPPINLFNPALGQLKSVHVTASIAVISTIKSQNTSSSSPASITPFITGDYKINGLPSSVAGNLTPNALDDPANPQIPLPVNVPVNVTGPPFDFTGPTTVVFGFPSDYVSSPGAVQGKPVNAGTGNTPVTLNYTSPADLTFFTATAGRSSFVPTLDVNAQAGASSPNGNLQTSVTTFGGAQISVVYEYQPVCPSVVKLVRYGIHHQPTQLQLEFSGPLDPTDAQNTANYRVVIPNKYGSFTGPGVTYVGITRAIYDPQNFTVTLITAKRLNVHHQYQLQVSLPCNDGNVITIQFGGKNSLGGFTGHRGQFIPVAHGRIVRG